MRNNTRRLLRRTTLGALGGLAGTLAIQALLKANQRYFPESIPPIREEPGSYMVEQVEGRLPEAIRAKIPEALQSGAAGVLGMGYGVTFGALYGALRPEGGSALVDGVALGLICWAAGYLGWLPAMGLMPPVWKQKPGQVAAPVLEHLAYGMVSVAAFDWAKEQLVEA